MSYFTTHETFFVIPLHVHDEELRKIDIFLILLEKSGVGEVIEKAVMPIIFSYQFCILIQKELLL